MKIFKMNDFDWCAGDNLEEVVKFYLDFVGLDESEALDYPEELSDEEMDRLIFYHGDYSDVTESRSFREELDRLVKHGDKFPLFFASTEL